MIHQSRISPTLKSIAIALFVVQLFFTAISVASNMLFPLIVVHFLMTFVVLLIVGYIMWIPKMEDKDRSYLFLFILETLIILCGSTTFVWDVEELLEILLSCFLFLIPSFTSLILQKGSFRKNMFLALASIWMMVYMGEKIAYRSSGFYVQYETIFPKVGQEYQMNLPFIVMKNNAQVFPINCKFPSVRFNPSLPEGLSYAENKIVGTVKDAEAKTVSVRFICNQIITATTSTFEIIPCESSICPRDVRIKAPQQSTLHLYNPFFWIFQAFLCSLMILKGWLINDGSVAIFIKHPNQTV